jgi:hypothetical protein
MRRVAGGAGNRRSTPLRLGNYCPWTGISVPGAPGLRI